MNLWDSVNLPIEKEVIAKFKQYKRRSLSKGMKFTIKLQEFNFRITQNCYVCKIKNAKGLDRIDNERGYSWDNIYPCCFDCNRMKSNKSKSEFLDYIARLNPKHELLTSFNRVKDFEAYNKKIKKLHAFMADALNNPKKFERE